MSSSPAPRSNPGEETKSSPAEASKSLLRAALKGALATLDKASGHPYASLVTVATEPDGTPLLLISKLALHTQNLAADARASLLIDGTSAAGDTLAGGRVTFIGRIEASQSPTARTRFLARHPAAQVYADFPDFRFYALKVERAHFIGGFGRIVDLQPPELATDIGDATALVEAEAGIIEHMNEDHADAVQLYAEQIGKIADGGLWRMSGIDPEGCDLIGAVRGLRIGFPERIGTPGDARRVLVQLVGEARRLAEQAAGTPEDH